MNGDRLFLGVFVGAGVLLVFALGWAFGSGHAFAGWDCTKEVPTSTLVCGGTDSHGVCTAWVPVQGRRCVAMEDHRE